jgi:hypothetical protein
MSKVNSVTVPDWICIQLGLWIWILIQEGQDRTQKRKKPKSWMISPESWRQRVTKRCLSWLTNSALVFEPNWGVGLGGGGRGGLRVSANEYSCAT